MKRRFLSVLLTAVLLLTMMPFSAMAAEDTSEHDRLIALACEAFPEYASNIRNEGAVACGYSASAASNEIIYQETRPISDTESISIARSANGAIVIVDAVSSVNLNYSLNPTNTSNGVTGTVSFTVTSNWASGTFRLNNVGFEISYSASDSFSSYGTPSTSNGYFTVKYNKVSTSSTSIFYTVSYIASNSANNEYYNFVVSIDNDQITVAIH